MIKYAIINLERGHEYMNIHFAITLIAFLTISHYFLDFRVIKYWNKPHSALRLVNYVLYE